MRTSHPSLSVDLNRQVKVESEKHFHSVMVKKLDGRSDEKWFQNFRKCGKDSGAMMFCVNCGDRHPLVHRCSLKFCPICVWRITARRKEKLEVWQRGIKNPMHLVLTQKNFAQITRGKIREHYKNLTRLRRQEVFKNVRGGCTSVEVTNRGEGWHLHSHWLLDCNFIDIKIVSQRWGELCGQEFGIVQFKKITTDGYAKEVCKYVAKGSEVAKWPAEDLLNFILSVRKSRFFFSFGSLLKESARVNAFLAEIKSLRESQACTSCKEPSLIYCPDITMNSEKVIKHFA